VPAGPYAIADLGADVLRLLDALRIERAHFCGLSMGGTTGIWLGAHAPERIDRLVLCNTAAYFGPPDSFNARIATVLQSGMAVVTDGILARWFTPEFVAQQPLAVAAIRSDLLATSVPGYVACCEALRDLDERASLSRIKASTIVIGGTYDPAPTPQALRELAAQIPASEYVELPTAHLSNVAAPRAFNDAVRRHLIGAGAR
jgi:3-oxoadipate enol-lactonase